MLLNVKQVVFSISVAFFIFQHLFEQSTPSHKSTKTIKPTKSKKWTLTLISSPAASFSNISILLELYISLKQSDIENRSATDIGIFHKLLADSALEVRSLTWGWSQIPLPLYRSFALPCLFIYTYNTYLSRSRSLSLSGFFFNITVIMILSFCLFVCIFLSFVLRFFCFVCMCSCCVSQLGIFIWFSCSIHCCFIFYLPKDVRMGAC